MDCGRRFRLADMSELRECREKWEARFSQKFSDLWVPGHQDGFDRLIVVPGGMRAHVIYERLIKSAILRGHRHNVDNLKTLSSDRLTPYPHAVWVRDRQEADGCHDGKSYFDLLAECISGIAFEEWLVLAEDWWIEHCSCLDAQGSTLCTGSRFTDGNVPIGSRGDEWRDMPCYGLRSGVDGRRVREVVA